MLLSFVTGFAQDLGKELRLQNSSTSNTYCFANTYICANTYNFKSNQTIVEKKLN